MADSVKSNPPTGTVATVLSVAGSDPTGGAGIQADLKTLTSLGVHGAALVTCLTVQNSFGVQRIFPLPVDLVCQQLEAVLEDHRVSHIKIGMIGTREIASGLAGILRSFTGTVVYDPIIRATTGQPLFIGTAAGGPGEDLLSRVTVLTPNLPELEQLANVTVREPADAVMAAGRLLDRFPRLVAVLAKGGHGPRAEHVLDQLICRGENRYEIHREEDKRIVTRNSHGTGCTLASAYTAFLSLGCGHAEAFRQSCRYVRKLLRLSAGKRIIINRNGKGPLLHCRLGQAGTSVSPDSFRRSAETVPPHPEKRQR